MVVHDHYPKDARVARAARAAVAAGFTVTVISLRGPGEPAREVIDGVQIRRLPVRHDPGSRVPRILYEYLTFTLLSAFAVAVLHARRHQTIVHVHSPPDFLVAAGVVPRILGSRLLLDLHDLSPLMFGARFGEQRLGRFVTGALTKIQNLATSLADQVITVHTPYVDLLRGSGVPDRKLTVVMNSPDHTVIKEVSAARSPGSASGAFCLAYHGTVTPWYGTHLIVEALHVLLERGLDTKAVILGGGDDVVQVARLAEQLGVADRLSMSGRFVPLRDALAEVATADCGVVPNLSSPLNRYTLSSKMLDYVALGVPVVVAELETQAAHFAADEVTFFTPGDPNALADAVQWVATNPEAAREKALRASARFEEYAWPANRDRFERLCESLASDH